MEVPDKKSTTTRTMVQRVREAELMENKDLRNLITYATLIEKDLIEREQLPHIPASNHDTERSENTA